MYGTELVDGLRDLVRNGGLTIDQASTVADHFGDTFTALARQRVDLLVTVELDPDDEVDADAVATNVYDRVTNALGREFGGYYTASNTVNVSIDNVQDAW